MNSGCVFEFRETPTSQVTILSLYPSLFILWMAVTVTCIYRGLYFRSLANFYYIAYEGEGRDEFQQEFANLRVSSAREGRNNKSSMNSVLHML